MKAITTLILIAISSAWTATAQDSTAALEARVAMLEKQNLSLKAAIEAISGRTLAEILTSDVPAPATPAPAAARTTSTVEPAPSPAGPTPEQAAAMEAVKGRIAAIEAARKARRPDPFADRSGVKMSKADKAKLLADEERELTELRARLAAMEAAVR